MTAELVGLLACVVAILTIGAGMWFGVI